MFKKILSDAAKNFGLQLSEIQLEQFDAFYKLVIEWNEKINLTAITEPQEFAVKHITDSLSLWDEKLLHSVEYVIDVGTGAGFPGIPLKIFRPQIKLTLLDSLAKRLEFLKVVSKSLELEEVYFLHGRAEDTAKQKDLRENFDLVTSRAVARLNILSEYCLPFAKVGGKFAALKGKQFQEEVDEAGNAIKILGGKISEVREIKLPTVNDARAVIYIDKKISTPKKFPRKAGIPTKKPL